jgi:CheY-like chemotaxis protein
VAYVLALVDDLFFQAKLAETARQVGVSLRTVSTGEALVQAATAQAASLVIVDLNARRGAIEALEHLCAAGQAQSVVAFLSHVQTELAARARAAGCQEVLPRSKFTAELAAILCRTK